MSGQSVRATIRGAWMPEVLFPVSPGSSRFEQELVPHNRWHPEIPAAASVRPGATFRMECLDWTDEQVHDTDDASDVADMDLSIVHVLSGPIHVVGAEPGDLLVVDILDLGPFPDHSWGFTGIFDRSNGGGFLTEEFPTRQRQSGISKGSGAPPGTSPTSGFRVWLTPASSDVPRLRTCWTAGTGGRLSWWLGTQTGCRRSPSSLRPAMPFSDRWPPRGDRAGRQPLGRRPALLPGRWGDLVLWCHRDGRVNRPPCRRDQGWDGDLFGHRQPDVRDWPGRAEVFTLPGVRRDLGRPGRNPAVPRRPCGLPQRLPQRGSLPGRPWLQRIPGLPVAFSSSLRGQAVWDRRHPQPLLHPGPAHGDLFALDHPNARVAASQWTQSCNC